MRIKRIQATLLILSIIIMSTVGAGLTAIAVDEPGGATLPDINLLTSNFDNTTENWVELGNAQVSASDEAAYLGPTKSLKISGCNAVTDGAQVELKDIIYKGDHLKFSALVALPTGVSDSQLAMNLNFKVDNISYTSTFSTTVSTSSPIQIIGGKAIAKAGQWVKLEGYTVFKYTGNNLNSAMLSITGVTGQTVPATFYMDSLTIDKTYTLLGGTIGGFENGLTNSFGITAGTYAVVNTPVHGGTNAFSYTGSLGYNGYCGFAFNNLDVGQQYKIEAYVNSAIGLKLHPIAWNAATTYKSSTDANGWSYYKNLWTTRASDAKTNYFFEPESGAVTTGTAYIDNVTYTKCWDSVPAIQSVDTLGINANFGIVPVLPKRTRVTYTATVGAGTVTFVDYQPIKWDAVKDPTTTYLSYLLHGTIPGTTANTTYDVSANIVFPPVTPSLSANVNIETGVVRFSGTLGLSYVGQSVDFDVFNQENLTSAVKTINTTTDAFGRFDTSEAFSGVNPGAFLVTSKVLNTLSASFDYYSSQHLSDDISKLNEARNSKDISIVQTLFLSKVNRETVMGLTFPLYYTLSDNAKTAIFTDMVNTANPYTLKSDIISVFEYSTLLQAINFATSANELDNLMANYGSRIKITSSNLVDSVYATYTTLSVADKNAVCTALLNRNFTSTSAFLTEFNRLVVLSAVKSAGNATALKAVFERADIISILNIPTAVKSNYTSLTNTAKVFEDIFAQTSIFNSIGDIVTAYTDAVNNQFNYENELKIAATLSEIKASSSATALKTIFERADIISILNIPTEVNANYTSLIYPANVFDEIFTNKSTFNSIGDVVTAYTKSIVNELDYEAELTIVTDTNTLPGSNLITEGFENGINSVQAVGVATVQSETGIVKRDNKSLKVTDCKTFGDGFKYEMKDIIYNNDYLKFGAWVALPSGVADTQLGMNFNCTVDGAPYGSTTLKIVGGKVAAKAGKWVRLEGYLYFNYSGEVLNSATLSITGVDGQSVANTFYVDNLMIDKTYTVMGGSIGGFENGLINGFGVTSGVYSVVNTPVHGGTKAFSFNGTLDYRAYCGTSFSNVEVGQQYKMDIYTKTTTISSLKIRGNDGVTSNTGTTLTADNGWQHFNNIFTANATKISYFFESLSGVPESDTVYIDDVKLTKYWATEPIIQGYDAITVNTDFLETPVLPKRVKVNYVSGTNKFSEYQPIKWDAVKDPLTTCVPYRLSGTVTGTVSAPSYNVYADIIFPPITPNIKTEIDPEAHTVKLSGMAGIAYINSLVTFEISNNLGQVIKTISTTTDPFSQFNVTEAMPTEVRVGEYSVKCVQNSVSVNFDYYTIADVADEIVKLNQARANKDTSIITNLFANRIYSDSVMGFSFALFNNLSPDAKNAVYTSLINSPMDYTTKAEAIKFFEDAVVTQAVNFGDITTIKNIIFNTEYTAKIGLANMGAYMSTYNRYFVSSTLVSDTTIAQNAIETIFTNLTGKSFVNGSALKEAYCTQVITQAIRLTGWGNMMTLLSENNDILNINMTNYSNLSQDKKNDVAKEMADVRDSLHTISSIANAFDVAVQRASATSVSTDNTSTGSTSGGSVSSGGSYSTQINIIPINTISFSDLQNVQWAEESINALAKEGVVKGFPSGEFRPLQKVTREEFIKMLMVAFKFNLDTDAQSKFSDVDNEKWYYTYIANAEKQELINGNIDGTFGVGKEISRQEMATLAYRFALKLGIISNVDMGTKTDFSDDDQIANYAKTGILAMNKSQVIKGKDNNTFMPKDSAIRAEATVIIHRLMKL